MAMISVLVLTKNEAFDLPGCLASVDWSDDVHVFDSMSNDATPGIARAAGATLTQRAFDSYARQRNAAFEMLPFKHNWIFILDADERSTPDLAAEMQMAILTASEEVCGFRIRRKDFLFGTWLRYAQISPWYVRLVRRGKAHYVREVNEVLEIDGEIAQLKSHFDHYPFSKGMSHWLAKHNVYSTMEAEVVANGFSLADASWKTALFEKDFHRRRVAQKAVFYRLPARPLVKWLYMMFVRRAVLDGAAGVTYSTLQAIYEYFIVLKTRERLADFRQNPGQRK